MGVNAGATGQAVWTERKAPAGKRVPLPGRRASPGFTLIELLVALAVVGVLVALTAAAAFYVLGSSATRLEKANWRDQRRMGASAPRTLPLRVLFIGNSYTAANDLPEQVAALARSAGDRPAFEYAVHLVGGATLEQHSNDPEALALIRQGNWDFVVLQEQSMRPLLDPRAMREYARRLDREVRAREAFTMFFLTWARQQLPATQEELNRAYFSVARDCGAEVAPAGLAWQLALRADPQRVLHQGDGSHPNATGSYLAACVFFATFYGRSPVGLTGQIAVNGQPLVDLPEEEARALQTVAWQAVQEGRRRLPLVPDL